MARDLQDSKHDGCREERDATEHHQQHLLQRRVAKIADETLLDFGSDGRLW
jgi:hypothetical protein